MHIYIRLFVLFIGLCFSLIQIVAQQSITGINNSVFQNFSSMSTAAVSNLPSGWRIGADWNSGLSQTTQAAGNSGTGILNGSSTGGAYNFAEGITGSSIERSLGFLNSGSYTSSRSIVYAFTNNTGSTINQLNISWVYEKYRSGTRAWDWTFFHGNTSAPSTQVLGGSMSYPADADNITIYAPAQSVTKHIEITGLSIAPGSVYYLKWTLTGNGGSTNGQALAIDEVEILPLATNLCIGSTMQINPTNTPSSWSSSNSSIASVNTSGLVTAQNSGSAVISYSSGNTFSLYEDFNAFDANPSAGVYMFNMASSNSTVISGLYQNTANGNYIVNWTPSFGNVVHQMQFGNQFTYIEFTNNAPTLFLNSLTLEAWHQHNQCCSNTGPYNVQLQLSSFINGAWTAYSNIGSPMTWSNSTTISTHTVSLSGYSIPSGTHRIKLLKATGANTSTDGFALNYIQLNVSTASTAITTRNVQVNVSSMVNWANLQWPGSGTINCGGSLTVYGKVYDAAYTPAAGVNPSITVQVGVHTANTDPSTWPAGVWSTANYNAQVVNDDEYIANIGSNLSQGTYYYSFRYALNGTTCYRYGGFQGGFWNGSSNVNGVLTVNGLDWVNLQFPANGSICASGNFNVYGQVYEAGITNSQGATAGLIAEIGVSNTNSDPSTWASNAWSAASFNAQSGNNDEFVGTLSGLSAGTYYYTWRYKLANSCNYQYGGYNASGGGFWNGSSNVNGVLTVYANPVANAGLDITDASTCGKDNVTLSAAALSAGQSGAWTLSSGTNNTVVFNNPASSTSTFTGSYGGTYVLQWAVSSNGCTGTDQMTVTFNQPSDATISAMVGSGDLLWCGLTNTDWSTASNWYQKQAAGHYVRMSSAVPSLGNEVFTMSTANAGICVGNNTPTLSINSNAEDVYVGPGITWNLSNDSINIAQNLVNNGTIIASTGITNFTGSNNSTISGAGNTQLFNMRVNKSAGATLTLQQPVLVTNTLAMNQGNVFTTSANLLTLGTSSAAPGSLTYNSGTIVGPFKRYFANTASAGTAGLFPVGTAVYNRYADFNFGSGPGVDQHLTVEYTTGAPLQGGVPLYNGLPLTASGSLIQNYSADGYWSVIPTNNNYAAPITSVNYGVTLFANNLTGMQSPQVCRIIKSAGSNTTGQHHVAWQACGTHTPINGAANPQSFLITSTGSQGFSWFNIGTPNSQALPVELLSFNGDCNEGQVSLSWQTATEHNSDFFEVEKSRDGMNWQVLTTVNAAGKSTQLLNYEAMDAYAMEVNNYYRLTQVDIDGSKEIFNVINIRCDRRLHSYISAYPNPSTGSFQVILNDKQLVGSGILSVKDTKGTELLNRTIEVKPGINMFSVTDLNLAPGVYYIQIVNGERATDVLKEVIR
jgi:hypothetical protein